MAGSFSIPAGAGSAALLQAVDGEGIEPEALIKPESCFIAIGHTEFPGAALSPALPAGYLFPTQKDPARWRSLTGTKSGLWATGTAAKRLGDTLRASCIVIVLA